jgi:2-C-methyl-D-erythritol 4-phosphate cytidylyltransferase
LAITNDVKVYSFSRTQNNIDISQLEAVKRVKNVFNIEGKIDFIVNTGVLHKEPLATMEYQTICVHKYELFWYD